LFGSRHYFDQLIDHSVWLIPIFADFFYDEFAASFEVRFFIVGFQWVRIFFSRKQHTNFRVVYEPHGAIEFLEDSV